MKIFENFSTQAKSQVNCPNPKVQGFQMPMWGYVYPAYEFRSSLAPIFIKAFQMVLSSQFLHSAVSRSIQFLIAPSAYDIYTLNTASTVNLILSLELVKVSKCHNFTLFGFFANPFWHAVGKLNPMYWPFLSKLPCALPWSIDHKENDMGYYFCVQFTNSACVQSSIGFVKFKLVYQPWTLVMGKSCPCFEMVYLQAWTEAFCKLLPIAFCYSAKKKCWQQLRQK